jgi:hypothetical protein
MNRDHILSSRRRFLRNSAGALAVTRAVSGETAGAPLPKVRFGRTEVTRLIIGSNPLYGYSHFNSLLSRMMREWMTQDRRIEILHRCEKAGINTWQVHYSEEAMEDFRRYRSEGGRMNLLILGMGKMMTDVQVIKDVAKLNPIGIAHHGNMTDDRFRAGEMDKVRDFCKAVRDTGVPVGVSTHNPAVVAAIEDQGWDIDYYMTCMYRITRMPEEARTEFGEAPLGEIYMERDPERMCAMVRQTKRTCFAFKLLGAGRSTNNPEHVERAFRSVLGNIKPQDAVIVGMFPRYKDQVSENAALVRHICGQIPT